MKLFKPIFLEDAPETESIKGRGLLLALRFETDSQTDSFCDRAKQEKIFVVKARFSQKTVLFRPPLTLTVRETDQLVKGVRAALHHNAS